MAIASQKLEPTAGNGQNYGVLCHRQYVDRIREALLPLGGNTWLKHATSTETPLVELSQPKAKEIPNKCVVVPTREEKGPRKSRTGYSLLVIREAIISPVELPPMVRKQISWAGRVTHQLAYNDDYGVDECHGNIVKENNSLQSILKSLSAEIWMELKKCFNAENHILRMDIQPRNFNSSEVCSIFSDVANETAPSPIRLACSASKVSHVVNMIIQSTPSASAESLTIQRIYWGISDNNEHFEHMNLRLNDYATSEIIMEPTDPKTGVDEGKNVQWDAPVSRAYYKLAQVFENDDLVQKIASVHNKSESLNASMVLSHGVGLDLGASPGGWTQVLRNTLCIPSVVAIDPGVLAHRVISLQGIHHLRAEISSEQCIKGLAQHAPYSVVVCDASMSNANELLVKIAETFDRVLSWRKKSTDCISLDRDIFAWPLCLVVTLKLPYKTNGSVDRNMEKVNDYIPHYLRRIALIGSSSGGERGVNDVEIRHKICHLFANSASERTLIAIFHKIEQAG